MSKKNDKKSKGKKGPSSASKNSAGVEIDPVDIRFTHARIRPFFTGCGKRIQDTIQEIIDGTITVADLPLITVIENEGHMFSLNNRRLYVIKHIQSLGLLQQNTITVLIKPALEREKKRYTIERCVLQAKIMKEFDVREDESEDKKEGVVTVQSSVPVPPVHTLDTIGSSKEDGIHGEFCVDSETKGVVEQTVDDFDTKSIDS
mmetsp:Transcript_14420/g.23932  ORF Transcript_14420/g.23932 Transcript_14420/m.23932 type:complete len:203 (+) Transcript_14420:104-712(+)